MKLLSWAKDGGKDSHVDGFFIIEMKKLFSIVVLRFSEGTREAYHNHAFNAVTLWVKGRAVEEHLDGKDTVWVPGDIKYTSRNTFHRVRALVDTWAISFRGPWKNVWREYLKGKFTTLTHGRKVVNAGR